MPQLSPAECSRSSQRISWNRQFGMSIDQHIGLTSLLSWSIWSRLHLKGSKDIFYEDASLDGSSWQSKLLLAPDEDAVPKCCFAAPLQLGEIKERTTPFRMESRSHMIHKETKIYQGTGSLPSA